MEFSWMLLIAALVGLFWIFKPWQMFAGGNAADLRAPYPHGEIYTHKMGPFTVVASKSADFVVEKWKLPFACRVKAAYQTAQDVVVANGITINLQDDTGTPNIIISDEAVAAITGGAGSYVTLPVDIPNTIIKAGAFLILSYASGASDTAVDLSVYLELEPVYR